MYTTFCAILLLSIVFFSKLFLFIVLAPVFVVQHLFDEAQIAADNVGTPTKKEQWTYIHHLGHDMRHTLLNVR